MNRLLLVEDNEGLLANLYAWFEPLGYELDSARQGLHARDLLTANTYDCIILDINLPRLDGFALCAQLRTSLHVHTPILMLTARDAVEDRVKGLSLGADDYLTKPFSLRELQARVEALLRRPPLASSVLTYADIRLDAKTHRVQRAGVDIRLAPAPFRVLEALLQAAPSLVPREQLEQMLWGDDVPGSGALRNHIMDLRRALDRPGEASLVETVPHLGYRLRLVPQP